MIFFGPADFLQGIGVPCKFDDERVIETRKLVAKMARKYGKMAGITGSIATAQARIDEGYNFINLGADVVLLGEGFSRIANEAKQFNS